MRTIAVGVGLSILSFAPAAASAQYSLVSVATDGTRGNGPSDAPSLSGDGRFVAFASQASNLVANDTNDTTDVFVRDRVANTTTRVSVTSAGEQRAGHSHDPRISADGRFVVFLSGAPLVADDANACPPLLAWPGPTCQDVYVHDRQTGTTTRVSVSTGGTEANQHSTSAEISADGRFVVFTSSASNLVADDTNGSRDAFLRDRDSGTTTRLSLMPSGAQIAYPTNTAHLSADGRFVVFESSAVPSEFPTPRACMDPAVCPALFLYTRVTGQVQLLSAVLPTDTVAVGTQTTQIVAETPTAITADGETVVVSQEYFFPSRFRWLRSVVYDRTTGRLRVGDPCYFIPPNLCSGRAVGISPDGRYLDVTGTGYAFVLDDRLTGRRETHSFPASAGSTSSFSADSRFLGLIARDEFLPGDTNGVQDVFVYDRDIDGDGMLSDWETAFGLNAADASDAAADPDADGLTNLQEYQRGSHPTGTFTRYLAEGAANAFFSTRIAAMNPNDADAAVTFHFTGSTGLTSAAFRALAGRTQTSLDMRPNIDAPENDFATVIESNRPIVVDRTMRWDATGFGAHAETAIAAPSMTWYLAEGATHGAFDLFYLLQNASATEAHVTVRYLRLAPATPIVKTYSVPANGRRTLWVDTEDPGLEAVDVGATITSDQPIIVERAMYASTPAQAFAAGHEGAAVAAPSLTWFLAEGATGSFFDEYVLVANPNTTPAQLTVSYLLPDGVRFSKPYTVAAESRLTISVDGEDPRLADTPVSVIVESTNSQPVVVERAMWWPSPNWYEAHLSAGATTTGTRWGLADGEVIKGAPDPLSYGVETYVLIANTSSTPGTATVTLVWQLTSQFQLPLSTTVDLPANSRVNVPISPLFPEPSSGGRFGVIVESSGPPIVVERAMYFNANGVLWAAGTAALATKLQ